jgi:fructuronate reductase
VTSPRLSERNLRTVRPGVAPPEYPRRAVHVGVVHFGAGAFHRAHQAFYFDRLLRSDRRWGISAVSLRSSRVREALRPQDWLYTLVELGEESRVSIIGALREVLVASEQRDAIFSRLEAPDTRLVTVTVTEKGYCLDSNAQLAWNHPEIAHDLASPREPRSLIGWIAEALRRRRSRGVAPFAVVSCDNLPDNGPTLRKGVIDFVARSGERSDQDLAAWIRGEVAFPRTMVDSITPASDESLRRRIEKATGLEDAWPVQREAFTQWVIERSTQLPDAEWEAAGVTIATDVESYGRAKLRLVNGAHSTLAYVGLLRGHQTVSEAMSDAPLARFVERMMREDIAPCLTEPASAAMAHYIDSILLRFRNPELRHLLSQVAWDGSKKLPVRLIPTVQEALKAGRPIVRLAVPLAGWMRFIVRQAKNGVPIEDPSAARLEEIGRACTGEARADVARLGRLEEVFPPELTACAGFMAAIASAYQSLGDPAAAFESDIG